MSIEAWQNQAAFTALAGGKASQESQNVFQQRLDALKRRSQLAQALGTAYSSITSLRSPEGLAGVAQAGQNLGNALGGIPGLPGGSAINAEGIGQAAQFLVGIKRKSDSRKAVASMATAVAFLNGLLVNEQTLYIAVQEDRDGTADRLLKQLASAKIVKTAGLLRDLHIGVTPDAFDEDQARDMALAVAGVSIYRKRFAWACATDHTTSALALLTAQQKDLATPNSTALDQLEHDIARTKSCLADYRALEGAQR